MLDFLKKPAEGWKQEGVGGFVSGLGFGLVGSVVKPISKLGQAVSDIGSGIAAQVTPDTASIKRRRERLRQRQPRLLFGALGEIRPFTELDAEILRQFGWELTHGIEEVVPLTSQGTQRTVLMLFSRKLIVAEVKLFNERGSDQGQKKKAIQHGV